jgi:signal transduction histidine kinase
MADAPGRSRTCQSPPEPDVSSRRIDVGVGAAGTLVGAGGAAAAGSAPIEWLTAAAIGAALALYRARPTLAWILAAAAAAAAAAAVAPSGSPPLTSDVLTCANAFATGRWAGHWSSPFGAATLAAASLADTWIGHGAGVPALLIVGTAWAAGRAIRERDLVAARLAERAAELDRERDSFAALSVRDERARIASELHDIVAHAITVMVVQASAGQRLAAVDPSLTANTFAVIGDAARQAEQDMAQLVVLLADDDAIDTAPDLTLIEELIARASGTGLDVTLRLEGAREGLPAPAVQTAYHVVRESLTNALRYASGAPIQVLVSGEPDTLVVQVTNDPAPGADVLAGHGTGNGLRGMRERVGACGGRLEAGHYGSGGWRVAAHVPRRIAVTSRATRRQA